MNERVIVPLGARHYEATVIEYRDGRIYVAIEVPGSETLIRSSYLLSEVEEVWCDG